MLVEIAPEIYWLSNCRDEAGAHSRFASYLVKGERTLMSDTCHPASREGMLRDLEEALDGRDLDYLYLTHIEVPHSGNYQALVERYPNVTVVSGTSPWNISSAGEPAHYRRVAAGDVLDLGDHQLEFVEPALMDQGGTLWAYDRSTRTLFSVDAFSFPHDPGECGSLAEKLPRKRDARSLVDFYAIRYDWMKLMSAAQVHAELDRVFGRDIELIAPGHGNATREPLWYLDLQKQAMSELMGR